MKLRVIQQRTFWWLISGFLILAGLVAMGLCWQQFGAPLRPGLDFVGGTRLQLELDCTQPGNCDQAIDLADVRQVLNQEGLANSNLQIVGKARQALSIRTKTLDVEERDRLQQKLTEAIGQFDSAKTQIDAVGPTLGRQLFQSGLLALVLSFLGITAYLGVRFQLDYAVLALVALFHDVLVTMGVFAMLGLVAGTEVNSLFIVALLTIVGFSVNDTVVIYDRVRETLASHTHRHINDVVDEAVDQTLTRSINTSLTTTLPLIAILIFGGETLKDFALALIIGFVSGAYSSIFVASTMLAWWREFTGRAILEPPSAAEISS